MTDDQIRELVKAHTDEVLQKLANLTTLVTTLTEHIDQRFTALETKVDKVERKLTVINDRLLSHEVDIRELQEKA